MKLHATHTRSGHPSSVCARASRRDRAYPFVRFVRDNKSPAYNLAYRILGDQKLAVIATQEAFLRAFPIFQERRRKASKLWLIGLVVAVCEERMSRLPPLECRIRDTGPGGSTPEANAALTDDQPPREEAQAFLDTLPPDQRVTLVLRDIQGLSCKEIVHVTGASAHLIRLRLSEGRTTLRDALLAHGGLSPPV